MRLLIFFLFLNLSGLPVMADSPLTSTIFYTKYKHKLIKECIQAKGKLNNNALKYLVQSKELELKVALVNASGWKSSENNNHVAFLNELINEGKYSSEDDLLASGSRDDLIVYAYLMSLNNYFDVSRAYQFAQKAYQKDQSSKVVALIKSLIQAQTKLYLDWCQVYTLVFEADQSTIRNSDMKKSAVDAIFKYISKYKPYCDSEKTFF